jgi:glucose-1-phosphate cytidylyltransferase
MGLILLKNHRIRHCIGLREELVYDALMNTVILCGGKGTRLAEETSLRPKPMVHIGDNPILWHIMKIYASQGFRRFILPLGYKGNYIRKYFLNFRDWDITFVNTGLKTLKGGRIKRVGPHIKADHFHLTYGDGVTDIDLKKLHRFHLNHNKVGTVSVVHPPSRFGEMTLKGKRVVSFEEKPQLSKGQINGGFFVFQTKFLTYLKPDADCDLEFGALQKLADLRQLQAYKHSGFWQCMDTMRERDYLNKLWEKGAPWKVWK